MNTHELIHGPIPGRNTHQYLAGGKSFGRSRRLTLCLATVLAPVAAISASPISPIFARVAAIQSTSAGPTAPQILQVTNCSDGDPGSLRAIIEDPATLSGDTVDLSQLPTFCGDVDSVITLFNGEINVAQDELTLSGPASAAGTVTVSAGGASQVFHHTGSGTLKISQLTIANGYRHRANDAAGGCIQSQGSVTLDGSRVIDCTALTDTGYSHGGGIFAVGNVQLVASTVSGNKAIAPTAYGVGGGICSQDLRSKYSAISHNVAYDGSGGGATAYGNVGIYHSTVDNNTAFAGSALTSRETTRITNSTISGNGAGIATVLTRSGNAPSLEIANSTIAFNHMSSAAASGAIYFDGNQASDSVSLYSSIIAKNIAGPGSTPADIYVLTGQGTLSGADNLVMSTNVSPPSGVITVTADPRLRPLQLNGGTLLTHVPQSDSPALGMGNHSVTFPPYELNTYDQRGPGYPRTTDSAGNVTTDIGAVQFDKIFSDDLE